MKDEGALKPEGFSIQKFIEQPNDMATLSADEKVLAQGAESKFWITLKKHFDIAINQLEQINDTAMASGMPLEEIGRNALVISQVRGVLRKIENSVQDAKEALENGGETK